MNDSYVLQMKNITKEFDKVRVLDSVNLDVKRGEVHAIVGANGAGKSTLMKILNGIYVNYTGEIVLKNEILNFNDPIDALNHGITMIHQELDLVTNLDVSENIFLGREKKGQNIPVIDRPSMRKEAQALLDSLGFPIDANRKVESLSPAMQQLVLIARIVAIQSSVVVMDEPTSSLSISETEKLFSVIKDLSNQGISVIYISHFLEEIFTVADRVTVLRDGKNVTTRNIEDFTKKQIVECMIGHCSDSEKKYIRDNLSEDSVLQVKELTQKNGIVKDVSFNLRKGEVLGIAGVVGSGRTELARMIFGAEETASGEIILDGKKINVSSPAKAVSAKLAFIPEDRKTEGLVLKRTIRDNISLASLKKSTKYGVINYGAMRKSIRRMIDFLCIKCHSEEQEVRFLSGGNQQKVVIGKWLSIGSRVIILDQPTRGVDVGAKEEIYSLIDSLAKEGTSIIFISDELEEILSLSDRILVLKKGKVVHEFDNSERFLCKTDLLTPMVSEELAACGA